MKIIYVVIATTYDDFCLCGVATSKKRAEQIAEAARKEYTEEDYWTVHVTPYTDGVYYE